MGHPATGPITPEQMRALADAPYGKAGEVLRRHDPAWGLSGPDTPLRKYDVTLTAMLPAYAVVEVEATNPEQARKIAMQERFANLDWDIDGNPEDVEVQDVDLRK
jgi:hypothetical protein